MKRLLFLLLLLAHCAAPAAAQQGLVVVADRMGNDVNKWLHLSQSSSDADANAVAINSALRDSTKKKYNFGFPAGTYYIGKDTTNTNINGCCVLVPETVGHGFFGKGLGTTGDVGQGFTNSAVQFIYAGPKVNLGSTTESLSSATITFTAGYQVLSQDVGGNLDITGGTGATTGLYVITSVNTGANTWTLDHAPGGSASNLTGYMTYALWKDDGNGSNYSGIGFKGAPEEDDVDYCRVGLHFGSNQNLFSGGKAMIELCSFMNFKIANLLGRDARYIDRPDITSYAGDSDNHVDHVTWIRPWFQQNQHAIAVRNTQSVCHSCYDPRVLSRSGAVCTFAYLKKGGEFRCYGGDFSGANLTALQLGENGTNVGGFIFQGASYDSETSDPSWLQMDAAFQGHNQVQFIGCRIDEGCTDFSNHLWDAKGAVNLLIQGCYPVRSDSILLTNGGGGFTWRPHATIIASTITDYIDGSPVATQPYDVVDTASTNGTVAKFFSNMNHTGEVTYDDGKYVDAASPAFRRYAFYDERNDP